MTATKQQAVVTVYEVTSRHFLHDETPIGPSHVVVITEIGGTRFRVAGFYDNYDAAMYAVHQIQEESQKGPIVI